VVAVYKGSVVVEYLIEADSASTNTNKTLTSYREEGEQVNFFK